MQAGDVVLAFPGEEHSIQSAAGKTMGMQFVSYDFMLQRGKSGVESAAERKACGGLVRRFLGCRERVCSGGEDGMVGTIFGVVRKAMEEKLPGWEQIGSAASRSILLGTAQMFVPSHVPQVLKGRGEWSWINWSTMRAEAIHSRAYSYLSSHIGGDVRVEEVARHLGTSVRNLQRVFGKSGYSFRSLLHDWRVKEAKYLLIGTDLPINRIARMVGINNFSHFTATFRRMYGMSPGKFRQLRDS